MRLFFLMLFSLVCVIIFLSSFRSSLALQFNYRLSNFGQVMSCTGVVCTDQAAGLNSTTDCFPDVWLLTHPPDLEANVISVLNRG